MSLYRDEAIVLRTQKLGEADRIITMLTRDHGRIRGVAKGVRRTKSKFGARLEPGSHVDIQLYTGKTFDTVTQVEALMNYGEALTEDAGYAPSMTICSRCEKPGPHRYFSLVGGGSVCADCRPSACATPAPETLELMGALLSSDWDVATASEPKFRREASGLIAAYLQWHLERGLRSLSMVERV